MEERRERVVNCGKGIMYLVVCGDEGLFQKRADNKSFAGEIIVPGGKGGGEEDHDAIARREIEEETGLRDVKPMELGPAFNLITPKAHKYLMKAYIVEIDRKELATNNAHKEGNFVWLPLNEAISKIEWAHGQLVLNRAVNYLKEERNVDWPGSRFGRFVIDNTNGIMV